MCHRIDAIFSNWPNALFSARRTARSGMKRGSASICWGRRTKNWRRTNLSNTSASMLRPRNASITTARGIHPRLPTIKHPSSLWKLWRCITGFSRLPWNTWRHPVKWRRRHSRRLISTWATRKAAPLPHRRRLRRGTLACPRRPIQSGYFFERFFFQYSNIVLTIGLCWNVWRTHSKQSIEYAIVKSKSSYKFHYKNWL